MTLQKGSVLNNRYRILSLLGQGGFGAVYRAADMTLKRPCAVKENLDTSSEAERQFEKEAIVMAQLSHPNLPRVQDHFTLPGQGQYLVMDFVEGEDLEAIVAREGPLPQDKALDWIGQIANALTYLHEQNPPVIHRDLKPANIRVRPDGRAFLVDFGLVKIYDPHLRTTIGARAVTPGYSPMEQYGQGNTDARTDVYALAATLYTLLTGLEPQESVQRAVDDQLSPAHRTNVQVSFKIGDVIQHAMTLKPSQRYQTVAELHKALQPLQKPSPRPKPAHAVGSTPQTEVPAWVAARRVSNPPTKPVPIHSPSKSALVKPSVSTGTGVKPKQKTWWQQPWFISVVLLMLMCIGIAGIGWIYSAQELAAANSAATRSAYQVTEQARSTATAQAQIQQTATAQARLTATAQAREIEIAALEAKSIRVFGPEDGSLEHVEDDSVAISYADVDLKNFIVEAVFYNPYPTSKGAWDYGFLFRNESGNNQYRLTIHSYETWNLDNWTDDSKSVDYGQIANLNISSSGANTVKLIVNDKKGWFYINGQFISELDLSDRLNAGYIQIATGIYAGDEIDGEETRYEDFRVWEIP